MLRDLHGSLAPPGKALPPSLVFETLHDPASVSPLRSLDPCPLCFRSSNYLDLPGRGYFLPWDLVPAVPSAWAPFPRHPSTSASYPSLVLPNSDLLLCQSIVILPHHLLQEALHPSGYLGMSRCSSSPLGLPFPSLPPLGWDPVYPDVTTASLPPPPPTHTHPNRLAAPFQGILALPTSF